MAELFHLSVLAPERSVIEADVVSIIVPGSEGYLGVLAHHAPLITALVPGKLTVKGPDREEEIYAIAGGFLEVSDNRAVILADSIERADQIDVERARRARERAVERLRHHDEKIDTARAEAALQKAVNRIRIASIR
jgi:F-type H+-transporting ATPase subunit epsilon